MRIADQQRFAPDITNKTATGCTVLLKNTLGLAITVAADTISLLATHD